MLKRFFWIILLCFQSSVIAAQSVEVLNQDTMNKYYPNRSKKHEVMAPSDFLNYHPGFSAKWLLVERVKDQNTYIDLNSVREKVGSPFMFAVFHTTNLKGLRLYNKTVTDEYSWRAFSCGAGDSIVFKSSFKTDGNEFINDDFPIKSLPYLTQEDFQIDIACVRL